MSSLGLVNGVRTDSNFTTIGAYRCAISVISVIEISLSVRLVLNHVLKVAERVLKTGMGGWYNILSALSAY